MRILIVEDEYSLADIISNRLKKEKYIVDISNDGESGLDNSLSGVYDLIILDVMLPKIDGFEILKEIRKYNIDTKVIMLTARSEVDDKVHGLLSGADDYLTKPFHMDELVARINVQLRKNKDGSLKDILEFNDLRLYLKTSAIECITTGESIEIGCKEFLLLEYLMRNENIIISRDQIYDKIWGIDNDIESNNLEAYLSFIRKKLKIIGSNVNVKAIRGMGYKLVVKDEKIKE